MNHRSNRRRISWLLAAALIGALMVCLFHGIWKSSPPPVVSGRFVATSQPGVLTGTGSPPMEAIIEQGGGKVNVKMKSAEGSALGLKFNSSAGVIFDADPKWFVSFDENDVLHYGIHPKWVNRIEVSHQSSAIRGIEARDRDAHLAKVAKALNW